jgi:hypothetical protein
MPALADAGGEPGDALFDLADPVHDQPDQRHRKPEVAARHHGLGEAAENGGKTLGGGAGWNEQGGLLSEMS